MMYIGWYRKWAQYTFKHFALLYADDTVLLAESAEEKNITV